MKEIRVRYAPSPTGYLHIGNARTAIFNFLFARRYGGKFIVRIEDTDLSRNIFDGVRSQMDNLLQLGVHADESIDHGGEYGPYSQMDRHKLNMYMPHAEKMINSGHAYKCFCSSEELQASSEQQKRDGKIVQYDGKCRNLTKEQIAQYEAENRSYTIRAKLDPNQEITWHDLVRGDVKFRLGDITGDFNIIKRDGIPTYNFAVVVDDYLMKISHVLRGEDHISNTPKQIAIYKALGWNIPKFGHMTLIFNENGKKLSKRDNHIMQNINDYLSAGYLPESIFNFISLLGFTPETNQEIMDHQEIIDVFDVKRLSKAPAIFDPVKLKWVSNQHMKLLKDDHYLKLINDFYDVNIFNEFTEENKQKILLLYKDQISYFKELTDAASLFLKDNERILSSDLQFIKDAETKLLLEKLKIKFTEINWQIDLIKPIIMELGKELGIKGKNLFMSTRIGTTHQSHGPELDQTIFLLGKEKVINNLSKILEEL